MYKFEFTCFGVSVSTKLPSTDFSKGSVPYSKTLNPTSDFGFSKGSVGGDSDNQTMDLEAMMITLPVCGNMKIAVPHALINLDNLREGLTGGELRGRTADGAKKRLPVVCLGGAFKRLPPDADHGDKCGGRCGVFGYRNEQHLDWGKRTGIVLLDVDEVAPVDADAIRARFEPLQPVCALWRSASGAGFKVGVAMEPIPQSPAECRDAWGTAALLAAALLTGIHHRIDPTHSPVQVAILAHDSQALVREPATRLRWQEGDFRRARPKPEPCLTTTDEVDSVSIKGGNVEEVAAGLAWEPGNRTTSLFRLGIECGKAGWTLDACLPDAIAIATACGLLAEDGNECIGHFKRGWDRGADTLCTIFGVLAAPAQQGG